MLQWLWHPHAIRRIIYEYFSHHCDVSVSVRLHDRTLRHPAPGRAGPGAGDTETVEQLVDRHIPRWSRGILKVTGVTLTVEGLENIPREGPCVFVGNHRSYYDIPLLLASLDKPHGILAKEELEKFPC